MNFNWIALSHKLRAGDDCDFGGEKGIRTPDTIASEHAFQAGALNRSAISPLLWAI